MPYRRPKTQCEVCSESNRKVLDRHHIIPKTDPKCTELDSNLAVVCSNCHRKIHAGEIIIEGVFPTSVGKKLFWHYSDDDYIVIPGVILHADGTATVRENNE
jgi:hypothetical protein